MIGIISVLWSGSREYGMHDLLEEMKAFQQEIVKKLPINKLCGIYSEGNERSLRQMCDMIRLDLIRIPLVTGWGMYWRGKDCGNDLGQRWEIWLLDQIWPLCVFVQPAI